ncbi:hypothetical protein SERLA73DRAFT_99752 [Serpula lacrymans var. lacrymans S7.3]|uniref:PARP catalytic domain-containing protein n=2 Tax=Serpula lacrymans var. lacrymans TaxID=341189 RepID=F8QHY7_SERL3|nr:uncharacterized protein SERLADRAFT_363469 [Serpula lacrymans var. lacrymans S7.9]EGN92096.1 hypothetical protein SERLA73DRAFT_99752 [Serpula lacrymans var. lacrymans S7.3]EGO20612.1 hypothetical protein SERLADRAFT_363469 [Serpula lacrymans var. lacrymans S7.9]
MANAKTATMIAPTAAIVAPMAFKATQMTFKAAPMAFKATPMTLKAAPMLAPMAARAKAPAKAKATNLCVVCHKRRKFKTSQFCSKACASRVKGKGKHVGGTAKTQAGRGGGRGRGLCDYCHKNRKYVKGKTVYPFCGKVCARKAKKARPKPTGPVCAIPGCHKPVFTLNGKAGKYCSRAHVELAKVACLVCRKRKRRGKYPFCGKTCARRAQKIAPGLLEAPPGHVMFNDIVNQFKKSWRIATAQATIKKVYKVVCTGSSVAQYNKYRAGVEARGHFKRRKLPEGNERRRWHGTRRECKLGDPGNTKLCKVPTCNVCNIMRSSLKVSQAGKNYGMRFGAGVYTSSSSETSVAYCRNSPNNPSPYKAMFLTKVVVGRTIKPLMDQPAWTAPPAGYDSVVAERNVIYGDELVVYTDRAIRPSYLIVFQ